MYEDITLGFEFEVEGSDISIYSLIDNSAHITGLTEHYIEDYHDTRYKTAEGLWRIEDDETISGAEFISPLMDYCTARKVCKDFFAAISNTPEVFTTNRCGLHVGMSVNGNLDGIDLASIIPNINYRLLATLWPTRMLEDHHYCNSLKKMLRTVNVFGSNTGMSNTGIRPSISSMSKKWMNNAYSFIKTKYYNDIKYIEFRAPGGLDYHLKFDALFTSIDHISDVLLGRTKLSKKETAKKMYSYLNRLYKVSDYTHHTPPFIPEMFLKNRLSPTSFTTLYNYTKSVLISIDYYDHPAKGKIRDNLNRHGYLYHLLEYMVANRMRSRLKSISDIINDAIVVPIPENKQQSDMIKMLKLWQLLPRKLIRNLLNRLNQKAYNHFIKYHINNAQGIEQYNWVFNVCKHELNHINSDIFTNKQNLTAV
jgi:hypothetical protein